VAEEANGQVEVLDRRPPEVGRDPRTVGEVSLEGLAVVLGQRQPEERAELQRAGLAQ
jgi:hypothetical protein